MINHAVHAHLVVVYCPRSTGICKIKSSKVKVATLRYNNVVLGKCTRLANAKRQEL